MKVYNIYNEVNGEEKTLEETFQTMEEARNYMCKCMQAVAEDYDGWHYFATDDELADEIKLAKDAIKNGDWSKEEWGEYPKSLKRTKAPCLVHKCGEIQDLKYNSISEDNWHTFIEVEDAPLDWQDIDEMPWRIEEAIKDRLESMTPEDEPADIELIEYAEIADKTYIVKFGFDGESNKAIYYADDEVLFTPLDWQGVEPETWEDIERCYWINDAGDEAVVVDGLPILFTSFRSDARADLGRRVRMAREKAGLTQQELAVKAGIKRNNLSRIESGRYNVTLDTITRLSAVLGVEL